jgi:hypothetical protein
MRCLTVTVELVFCLTWPFLFSAQEKDQTVKPGIGGSWEEAALGDAC